MDSPQESTPQNSPEGRPELAERLAFLELDDTDAQRLRGMAEALRQSQGALVESFYRHLFRHPQTARFLEDPQRLARLKQFQMRHFETLLEAIWDENYAVGRRRVGDTHSELGVEPQYFLGAYNQYIQHCIRECARLHPADEAVDLAPLASLIKAIFLDVGLTLDAYFAQSTQQLRNALDMLWKANHELRSFAQLTTHDLKTPLATVANLCDEALDEFGDQMPEGARHLVDSASKASFRMSRMIDELLSSSISHGTVEHNEAIALGPVFNEALDRLRPTLESKHIRLTQPSQWPEAWGNAVRLREALFNVLGNAAKFVEPNVGRIDVTVTVDGPRVRISVADNGPGIPEDELQRIFVPFRRLPAHREQPGFGLGLYFTKNLMELQNGRVWAESQPGQGSTFHLELPTLEAGEANHSGTAR